MKIEFFWMNKDKDRKKNRMNMDKDGKNLDECG
jgi:hypothetical protein